MHVLGCLKGPLVYQPMQILSMSQPFLSKSFDTVRHSCSTMVSVQPLERWRSNVADEHERPPDELECFILNEPMEIEIIPHTF